MSVGYLPYSYAELVSIIDSQMHPPWHDCADSTYYDEAHSLAVAANTPVPFQVNGLAYEDSSFPAHITHLWDKNNHKILLDEVLNNPNYMCRVVFMWKPDSAAAGTLDITLTPDNVAPDFSLTKTVPFKAIESQVFIDMNFYVKGQTKTNGLKVSIESSASGKMWSRGIYVTRSS